MMSIMRLDHVVIPVADAEKSLAFYGETLGLPLIGAHEGSDWGGKAWLMMAFALADGRELVLVALRGLRPRPSGLPADTRHYAFSVETDVEQDAWRQRLVQAGVDYWEEDHGDQRSIYFADPDGTVLEITTPPSEPAQQSNKDAWAAARAWIAQSQTVAV
jgi:catechol 2,3-dioxygenase-like lactoylglutathione lyase family enzyme